MSNATASPSKTIFVNDVIDNSRFGLLQLLVLVLTTLIAIVDGFDVTAMAVVAPSVAADWGIEPGSLGIAMSASIVGLAVGGLFGGPISDRFGRRPSLIGMFLLGLVATTATATANNIEMLVFWRFLTGVGLGGTIPLGAALASEFMPKKSRAFLVVLMFSGHPIGGALSSLAAPSIIDIWGWHAVFYAGGIVPFLLCLLMWRYLPEAPRFVHARGDRNAIVNLLKKADPTFNPGPNDVIKLKENQAKKFSIKAIFEGRMAYLTVVLWAVFFATQCMMYLLASWLPTLFNNAGIPLTTALYATMTFQLGGVLGSIAFGALSDRISPIYVLASMYALLAGSTLVLAGISNGGWFLFLTCFLTGVGAIGSQLCLNTFTTLVYPEHIRATGLGWALTVGRVGAVIGPLAVGYLMLQGLTSSSIIYLASVLPVFCGVCILLLRRHAKPAANPAVDLAH